jgi:hypothetical protein
MRGQKNKKEGWQVVVSNEPNNQKTNQLNTNESTPSHQSI